jgi:formate hydrogenlyase subunit 3/multisubunit Na+/H+ antiporter MnhD subunit
MILFGLCALLVATSGVPGLFLRTRGGLAAAWLMGLGALAGLAAAGLALFAGGTSLALFHTPLGTPGYLRLDAVGAFFLVPVLALPACGSIFALGYWDDRHESARRLRLLFGITTGFLVLLVAAAHALTFLLAWEGMAVTAYLLVMAEDREPVTQHSGWIYLACTHSGTLCLSAAFALAASATGGFLFTPLPAGFAATARGTATFLLFLAGFGLKAGIFPLHFWLPGAHAAAPSHVSSLMSGILIKMGILGLIRVLCLVPDPPRWWGATVLVLGAVSGLLGVAFALAQHDLKRLLAYHSIENIGIILLGLGLGTLGKSTGHPALQALGYAGALLHVLNHSLFKGLLFLGAGAVVHATGSRDLERMGGLARTMPVTAAAFLAGSWAICGLPPLNGFVSEWLIYLAAFRGLAFPGSSWPVLAIAALATIGALAAACFAKVFGVVFLGQPRSPEAAAATEPPRTMRAPLAILACACCAIGVAPILVAPALARAAGAAAGLAGPVDLGALAHLGTLSLIALPMLAAAALVWLWCRKGPAARTGLPTWDCGYTSSGPRVQYTASSFADGLVAAQRFVLWPRVRWRRILALFPSRRGYHSEVPDPVLDRCAGPGLARTARGLASLHFLQGGQLPLYLLYILITLVALLVWMVA